jgi:transcriptional regulator with XRE-family HTH domain
VKKSAAMNEQKLFAGPRIRRLRKERALTQAGMAEELGISTSYLNLIERNHRPVTAQLLLRLAESYDVDFKSFTGNSEAQAMAALHEVFTDPLFEGFDISRHELGELAQASPEASQAILTLYHAYRESATNVAELSERLTEGGASEDRLRFPAEQVRAFSGSASIWCRPS